MVNLDVDSTHRSVYVPPVQVDAQSHSFFRLGARRSNDNYHCKYFILLRILGISLRLRVLRLAVHFSTPRRLARKSRSSRDTSAHVRRQRANLSGVSGLHFLELYLTNVTRLVESQAASQSSKPRQSRPSTRRRNARAAQSPDRSDDPDDNEFGETPNAIPSRK